MLNEKLENDIIKSKRSFSIIASLCCMTSALQLVCGVIPSLHFSGYERPVAYFDVIRFVPKLSSICCICVIVFSIMNTIFFIVNDVPRIVCTVVSGCEIIALAISLFTLSDIGISIYEDAIYTLTPVIALEILVSMQSFALSLLALQQENKLLCKIEKKNRTAVLKSPSYTVVNNTSTPQNMNIPKL